MICNDFRYELSFKKGKKSNNDLRQTTYNKISYNVLLYN